MRIASSTVQTKILPSPMRPVWAACWMASTGALDHRIFHDHFDLHLGRKSTTYSAATIELGVPFWRPKLSPRSP